MSEKTELIIWICMYKIYYNTNCNKYYIIFLNIIRTCLYLHNIIIVISYYFQYTSLKTSLYTIFFDVFGIFVFEKKCYNK